MSQISESSSIHEVQCHVQDAHLGEPCLIDTETKLNMACFRTRSCKMVTSHEDVKTQLETLKAT